MYPRRDAEYFNIKEVEGHIIGTYWKIVGVASASGGVTLEAIRSPRGYFTGKRTTIYVPKLRFERLFHRW